MEGGFFKQQWTLGPPVPGVIVPVDSSELEVYRRQIRAQLQTHEAGLDTLLLQLFADAIDLFLEPSSSGHFGNAQFGELLQEADDFIVGNMSFPNAVVGTITYSIGHLSIQTHLEGAPAPGPTPLRRADRESLIEVLGAQLNDPATGLDPTWAQILSRAREEK